MKIASLNPQDSKKISFCAGKTTLGSGFDGTFIPSKYNHDAVCLNPDSINKQEFQNYFDNFESMVQKAKGEEQKFVLNITTDRNLNEFNYFMRKIKDNGLRTPIADSITILDGSDTFIKPQKDFFNSDKKELFSAENFSGEKREKIKQASNWDAEEVDSIIKKQIEESVISKKKNRRIHNLAEFVDKEHADGPSGLVKLYNDIIKSDMNEEQIRHHLEKLSSKNIANSSNPDVIKWDIGVLSAKIFKDKQNPKTYSILEAKTFQSALFYDEDMTLEGQLKQLANHPEEIIATRDDGGLHTHIGMSQADYNPQIELRTIISQELKNKGIKHNIESLSQNPNSLETNGKKLSSVDISPEINGEKLNKLHDYKNMVEEIMKGMTNDLVIVSGSNDSEAKMLNLFNYIGEKEDLTNIASLKKIHELPLISIYVNNGNTIKDGGHDFALIDKYFNSDGNVRFIHVNPTNPKLPHTLEEGIKVAMKEYAKRNLEFAKNLSEEMKDELAKFDYKYPIEVDFIKDLEEKSGEKLYNPAPELDFSTVKKKVAEKMETAADSAKGLVEEGTKKASKSKIGWVAFAGAAAVGIIAGIASHNKKKKAAVADETVKPISQAEYSKFPPQKEAVPSSLNIKG